MTASSAALAKFFWEQIYCHYGTVGSVVTDNGPEVQKAFRLLLEYMGIPQVTISLYNSKANSVVERGHFIIQEAIVKACKGEIHKQLDKVPEAFFTDWITTSKVTGLSLYYLLHGVYPVLPFDLTEATFLIQEFKMEITSEDLLALHINQLAKKQEDIDQAAKTLSRFRFQSREKFEEKFQKQLCQDHYQVGELVLIRNTPVEKSLNQKTKPQYIGPYWVV